jgi:hypothetical protein
VHGHVLTACGLVIPEPERKRRAASRCPRPPQGTCRRSTHFAAADAEIGARSPPSSGGEFKMFVSAVFTRVAELQRAVG